MRKKHNGFTRFMQQTTKGQNNDDLLQTEKTRSEFYQRYSLLLGVLRGERSWSSYVQEVLRVGIEERRACITLRKYLQLNIPAYPLGVYFEDDGSAYRQAIEYIISHSYSGQQERVSPDTDGRVSLRYTGNVYITSY